MDIDLNFNVISKIKKTISSKILLSISQRFSSHSCGLKSEGTHNLLAHFLNNKGVRRIPIRIFCSIKQENLVLEGSIKQDSETYCACCRLGTSCSGDPSLDILGQIYEESQVFNLCKILAV